MQPQQTWCLSHTAYKRHVERALLNTIEEALRKYHSKGFLGGTQRLRSFPEECGYKWSSWAVPRNPSKQAACTLLFLNLRLAITKPPLRVAKLSSSSYLVSCYKQLLVTIGG